MPQYFDTNGIHSHSVQFQIAIGISRNVQWRKSARWPEDGVVRFPGAVLCVFAQFQADAPAFLPQVRRNGA